MAAGSNSLVRSRVGALLLAVGLVVAGGTGPDGAAEEAPDPIAADELRPGFTTEIGLEFRLIPGGTFMMGGPDRQERALPRHEVTLSPFYAARQAVTVGMVREFVEATGHQPAPNSLGPDPDREPRFDTYLDFVNRPKGMDGVCELSRSNDQSYQFWESFVNWLSRHHERTFQISTEAQIEWIARGCADNGVISGWWEVRQPGSAGNWQPAYGFSRSSPTLGALGMVYPQTPQGIYLYPLGYCASDWYAPYEKGPVVDPRGPEVPLEHAKVRRAGRLWSRRPDRRLDRVGYILVTSPVHPSDRKAEAEPPPALPDSPDIEPEPLPRTELALPGGVAVPLLEVPAGRFTVGRPVQERYFTHEWPETPVVLESCWLGATEVTQAQFEAVTGMNPSMVGGADLPVHSVTMSEIQAFLDLVTALERRAGRLGEEEVYRLPFEAEWERAALAGSRTLYAHGDEVATLPHYAWVDIAQGGPFPVAQKLPNRWGFYDMSGNVLEICGESTKGWLGRETTSNWHPIRAADGTGVERPKYGLGISASRNDWLAARGGSWIMGPMAAEPTLRRSVHVQSRTFFIGFRLCRGPRAWRRHWKTGEKVDAELAQENRWHRSDAYLEIMNRQLAAFDLPPLPEPDEE